MSFTIGHTVFTNGPDSGSIVRSGGQIAFTVEINPGSLAAAQVADSQMRGYAETGHTTPIIWTDDPTWDGFYAVTSVSVAPIENYLGNGVMSAQVTIERLSESFEVFASNSITRPVDEHSVTPIRLQAAPSTRHFHESDNSNLIDYRVLSGGTQVKMTLAAESSRYALRAGDFYVGGVLMEEYYGGAWYPITGRRRLQTASAASTWTTTPPDPLYPPADNYRISNGLIRLAMEGQYMVLEKAHATGWHVVSKILLVDGSASIIEPSAEPSILRNDPLGITIRYPMGGGVVPSYITEGTGYAPVLDVSLRRGSLFATFVFSNKGTVVESTVVYTYPQLAHTEITGAIHLTTADANGNRWVMGTELPIFAPGNGFMICAFGVAVPFTPFFFGAYDLDDDAPANLVSEYWAAITEEQVSVTL